MSLQEREEIEEAEIVASVPVRFRGRGRPDDEGREEGENQGGDRQKATANTGEREVARRTLQTRREAIGHARSEYNSFFIYSLLVFFNFLRWFL